MLEIRCVSGACAIVYDCICKPPVMDLVLYASIIDFGMKDSCGLRDGRWCYGDFYVKVCDE